MAGEGVGVEERLGMGERLGFGGAVVGGAVKGGRGEGEGGDLMIWWGGGRRGGLFEDRGWRWRRGVVVPAVAGGSVGVSSRRGRGRRRGRGAGGVVGGGMLAVCHSVGLWVGAVAGMTAAGFLVLWVEGEIGGLRPRGRSWGISAGVSLVRGPGF